jgi:hypothetical protein
MGSRETIAEVRELALATVLAAKTPVTDIMVRASPILKLRQPHLDTPTVINVILPSGSEMPFIVSPMERVSDLKCEIHKVLGRPPCEQHLIRLASLKHAIAPTVKIFRYDATGDVTMEDHERLVRYGVLGHSVITARLEFLEGDIS